MYRIKQDPRTVRSCQLIYDAVALLVWEKPFSKITVTDVVTKAQVGRTTFYRCFDEIEDVLRMRCDQVFDELIEYIMVYRMENRRVELYPVLKPMLRYFYLNSQIIDLLLQAGRLDILQETFLQRALPLQRMAAEQLDVSEVHFAYISRMRISVMCAILVRWVETGKEEAPDQLADELMRIMAHRAPLTDFM